jgi:GrpB-like predicted nucleotidyltransferase (UPF0157 family)
VTSPHMPVLPTFRDAELVLAGESDELPGLLPVFLDVPVNRVDIEHPREMEKMLRESWPFFVRVSRVGGASPDGVTDRPVIDIDVLSTSRNTARNVAVRIEQFFLTRPHPIDRCNILMAPQMVPWVSRDAETTVRRFYASYHLSMRRSRVA